MEESIAGGHAPGGMADPAVAAPQTPAGAHASPVPDTDDATLDAALDLAKLIVQREADALLYVADALRTSSTTQASFRRALALALEYTREDAGRAAGKIVVVGVGKSGTYSLLTKGLIARKIASMLLSLGTQAVFLHPSDCLHGDLGLVCAGRDVILSLSFSGSSAETVAFMQLPPVQACARIAMTGHGDSDLAQHADIWLDCGIPPLAPSLLDKGESGYAMAESRAVSLGKDTHREAYPEIPAPTSSTTVMLALGDAFAIALTQAKGIGRTTFVRNHPGGFLGAAFVKEKHDD